MVKKVNKKMLQDCKASSKTVLDEVLLMAEKKSLKMAKVSGGDGGDEMTMEGSELKIKGEVKKIKKSILSHIFYQRNFMLFGRERWSERFYISLKKIQRTILNIILQTRNKS